jgi:hypothetical protein
MSIFDQVFARATVVKSNLSKQTGQPLYDLSGVGFSDDPSDSRGESKDGQEVFSSGGVVFRPPPPDKSAPDLFCEAIAARTSDGLVPLVFRDKRIIERINRGGGVAPKEGQILYAGYGGGFLSFELVTNGTRDQTQLYIPYERNGAGVPTKAHAITLGKDGTGKALVSVVSGEGPRLILLDNKGTLYNAAGNAWVELGPDGVGIVGNTKIYGGVDIGSPSFPLAKFAELAAMVTALSAHVGAITTQLNVVGPVAGAAGALTATLTPYTTAAGVLGATGSTLLLKGS